MPSGESFDENVFREIEQLPTYAVDALQGLLRHHPIARRDDELEEDKFDYTVNYTAGECGGVWLTDTSPGAPRLADPVVVKVFASRKRYAAFESSIVAQLSSGPPAPLVVPRLVEYDPSTPMHTVFSKVPGEVLPVETVDAFTAAEKQILGQKIGAFIAWLPTVISEVTYRRIVIESAPSMIPDRVNYIRQYGSKAHNGQVADRTLANVLIQIEDEYEACYSTLEAPIVGHDDLRVENIAFTRQAGQWVLGGVFDFGITKLSSPERELRHLAPFGKNALDAAIATYESATGHVLSRSLIHFWAIGQAAVATAYFAAQTVINKRELERQVKILRYLLPDKDWSDLSDVARTEPT